MKLWERVIEGRLRKDISISKNQLGFMLGITTTEAIYLIRRLIEAHRDRRKDLHMVFIDLEKAYCVRCLGMFGEQRSGKGEYSSH